jgi:predicted RND superfamily exporter protein
MPDETSTIFSFWQNIGTTAIGVVITLVGFWAGVIRHMVTKQEVCEMIENRSPYVQDRQFIMERLAVNKEIQAQLSSALQRNTEVMNELKVQIATLGKTLEALENRIERS